MIRRRVGFDADRRAIGPALLANEDATAQQARDAEHVYQVLRLGGFPKATVTHGKTWWANGAGEMWTGGRW